MDFVHRFATASSLVTGIGLVIGSSGANYQAKLVETSQGATTGVSGAAGAKVEPVVQAAQIQADSIAPILMVGALLVLMGFALHALYHVRNDAPHNEKSVLHTFSFLKARVL